MILLRAIKEDLNYISLNFGIERGRTIFPLESGVKISSARFMVRKGHKIVRLNTRFENSENLKVPQSKTTSLPLTSCSNFKVMSWSRNDNLNLR